MKADISKLFVEDPYDDLGFLFWQIMKAWQRSKQKMVDEFGITPSQMEILSSVFYLRRDHLEVTQVAISNLTNVDPMTTSTVLRNLEKKGLISRESSKTDTRARIVEPTATGEEMFLKAVLKVRTSNNKILETVDGELLKKQLRILLNVLTNLDN